MNIEQIKEEYAKEQGYVDYLALTYRAFRLSDKDATALMQRAFNAALELAAEKAEVKYQQSCASVTVNKESISLSKTKRLKQWK